MTNYNVLAVSRFNKNATTKVGVGVGSWEETIGQIPEHPQRLVSAK